MEKNYIMSVNASEALDSLTSLYVSLSAYSRPHASWCLANDSL